jgi:hypothetical protein
LKRHAEFKGRLEQYALHVEKGRDMACENEEEITATGKQPGDVSTSFGKDWNF